MAGEGFDLSSRISLDATDMVAGGKDAVGALDGVTAAEKRVEGGSKSLASAQTALMSKTTGASKASRDQAVATAQLASNTTAATGAISKASIASGALAVAEARAAIASRQLADAQNAAAKAATGDAAAQKAAADAVTAAQVKYASASLAVERQLSRQTNAQNDNAKTSIRQQYAIRNVGQQFGDFGLQVAGGIDPARAFGQQAGQLGYALSEMGGKLGVVGKFLTGPWGIALTIGAAVLAPFIESLFTGAKASDDLKDKTLSLEDALTKQAVATKLAQKAIDDYNDAQDKARKNDSLSIDISLRRAAADLKAANAIVEKTKALVADALAQYNVDKIRAGGTGQRGELGGAAAAQSGQNLAGLQALQTRQEASSASIAQAQRNLLIQQAGKIAANAVDPVKKLNDQFDRQRDTAIRAASGNTALANSLKGTLVQVELNRKKAVDAQEALKRGAGSTDALADAQARLATASSAVAKAEANLSILRINTAKQVKAGTLSEADREKALEGGMAAVNRAKDAEKGIRQARVDGNKAARDAAATERELASVLDGLVSKYEPATAAAQKYLRTQEDIAYLLKLGPNNGGIDIGDAVTFSLKADEEAKAEEAKKTQEAAAKVWPNAAEDFADIISDASEKLGKKLKGDATEAGQSFADAASQVGDTLSRLVGGNGVIGRLTSVGAGGGASLLSTIFANDNGKDPYKGYSPAQLREYSDEHGGALPTGVGSRSRTPSKSEADLSASLTKLAKGVGISDKAAETIGKYGGKAIQGAATGALANSVFAPIAKGLGLKTSKTGASIGGALGQLSGIPGGAIVGGILGSITGGLFKTTKTGSATIGSTGVTGTSGNSGKSIAAATTTANAVVDSLNNIVSTLGGTLGNFAVSIGTRGKSFVVDTTGSGKTKGSGTQKFDTAEEAQAAALANAIADGAVKGLSAAVSAALRSSPDVTKAVNEALKVEDVEAAIGGIGYQLNKTFKDFDQQAADRVAIARKYGLDVVKLEQNTADQRAALVNDTLKQSVGSLQDFLDGLKYGDLADGSATDTRAALVAKIATLQSAAAKNDAGSQDAIDQLSSLLPQLLSSSKDAFGTASPQYTADKDFVTTTAQQIIAMESDRINSAASLQQATVDGLNKVAGGVDETNDLLAQAVAILRNAPGSAAVAAANDYSATAIPSTLLRA